MKLVFFHLKLSTFCEPDINLTRHSGGVVRLSKLAGTWKAGSDPETKLAFEKSTKKRNQDLNQDLKCQPFNLFLLRPVEEIIQESFAKTARPMCN